MSKEQRKELNKKVMKGPIENKELALHIVKETAKGFYALAGLQVLGAILLVAIGADGYSLGTAILGAAILALIAFWMQKSNSRIAAIILLILGVLSVLGSISLIASGASGLGGIIISVFMLWFGVRATQATGYLAKHKSGGDKMSAPSA